MPARHQLLVLRRRAEFLAVARQCKKWAAPGLILQYAVAPDSEKPVLRYGLTASIKAVGNAVARNRARRRLRELARAVLPVHALPGDYVLIARDTTGTRDFAELEKDFLTALKKVGALRDGR